MTDGGCWWDKFRIVSSDSKDRLEPVEGVVPIVRKEEGSEHEMPVDIKANKCIQAGTVKTALAQDVFSSGKHNPAATE